MLSSAPVNQIAISSLENASAGKRKRKPAGTPDPDAEVVSLSPRTLLEADRYVCEICNQGFQRDQNLQMHRRRHKVPWKLLKREAAAEVRKRVFVCPEPSCLHHDPRHALGDLVGIKKHFRRKHSSHRQWVCDRCSKAYAVQSDYKAHLKTCGTRGHSCDCGRVFSRVESFIEHQDSCNAGRQSQTPRPVSLSCTTSSTSPTADTNVISAPSLISPGRTMPASASGAAAFPFLLPYDRRRRHNLELQLLPTSDSHQQAQPTSSPYSSSLSPDSGDARDTELQLSIGPCEAAADVDRSEHQKKALMASELARQESMKQVELAEREFANAKRIRQQAQAELENAYMLKNHATKQINLMLLQITCHSCRKQFPPPSEPGRPTMLMEDQKSLESTRISKGEGMINNNATSQRYLTQFNSQRFQ
ncbi:protein indeterminate-domain 16 [Canna indica]|uniref:Protein indeterminate-domain 16 n=1 Tax=Canna indica TaxID=4628 RepID=A0AAQ3K5V8_9LILI|nr:protein indeterminate-domain 16 [Canna indica]